MNIFKHHIPSSVDIAKPDDVEFNTTEDLINIPHLKKYSAINNFVEFVKSDNTILATFEDGYNWWVMGTVDNADDLDLPVWDGGKWYVEIPGGGLKTVYSDDVSSISGGLIVLKDGTTVKNVKHIG